MLRDRVRHALAPRRIVHAHCDVPCGIYDPHGAELAAKTVSRMVVLINENQGNDLEQRNKLIRCVKVKEEHAELCKRELQVL